MKFAGVPPRRGIVFLATLAVWLASASAAHAYCCICQGADCPQNNFCSSVSGTCPCQGSVICSVGIIDTLPCGPGGVTECVVIDPTQTSTPTSTATATATATATGTATTTATASASATATGTASNTPTATPVSQGGACSQVSQCSGGLFCSDGVCCDTACDQPLEQCNLPGQVGTCASSAAAAPAASATGLLAMLGVLTGAAFAALRWRRA
jgi:hypothetical protein